MDYQQARQIRNMPSLSELIRREAAYGGQGAIGSVKEALKQKLNVKKRLQAKMMGYKEKLDPMNWAKAMFGRTGAALYGRAFGRSEEDINYFAGRARPIGGRTYNIGETPKYRGYEPVRGSGDNKKMLSILSEMYKFMNVTHQKEIKRRELENNKKEEYQLESERRHKEFLKALQSIAPSGGTATQVRSSGGLGDFFGDIWDTVKGLVDKVSTIWQAVGAGRLLGTLSSFLMNPAAIIGTAGLAASAFSAVVASDPNFQKSFSKERDPIGMASAMSGDAGIGASIMAKSTSDKREKKLLDDSIEVRNELLKDAPWWARNYDVGSRGYLQDKKGLTPEEADFMMPGNQLDSSKFGDIGKRQNLLEGIKKKASNPQPENKPQKVPAAAPAPKVNTKEVKPLTTDQGQKPLPKEVSKAKIPPVVPKNETGTTVQNLSQQGSDLKMQAKVTVPKEQVINNKSVSNVSQSAATKVRIPSVRNQEETFQRMIFESTRVV